MEYFVSSSIDNKHYQLEQIAQKLIGTKQNSGKICMIGLLYASIH
jgi:hypothetical protein